MAEYRGERFGQIAEEKSTKGLISWNIISLEKLIKKYRENFISIHLSSHSRFFLYFIRYHFLRVWTFRIASCHLFNFYQIYWISSLTRPEISPLKKKKYVKHHFRTTFNFDSYSHFIFKHFSNASPKPPSFDPKLPNFSQHFCKCARENSRIGIFRNSAEIVSKVSLIKGVCFVVSSYLHARGEEGRGGRVARSRTNRRRWNWKSSPLSR